MSKPSNPAEVLAALGVDDPPTGLFETALTHRSFAYEQSEPIEHNERLELLGDSVVGLIVTDQVFRTYPEMSEGEIASLRASVVNTAALADLARAVGLGGRVRLGRGEDATGGRDKDSVLADAFEAVVGAAYLDRGFDAIAEVLAPLFAVEIERVIASGENLDAKGALQEITARQDGHRPHYEVTASGPEHEKRFTARVLVDGEELGSGAGRSKKEAEQNAARVALERFDARAPSLRRNDARAS